MIWRKTFYVYACEIVKKVKFFYKSGMTKTIRLRFASILFKLGRGHYLAKDVVTPSEPEVEELYLGHIPPKPVPVPAPISDLAIKKRGRPPKEKAHTEL
jgi:hypothetical protein